MKKENKKIFLVLIVIISTILVAVPVHAVSKSTLEGISYTYDGITAEKAERIVKSMYGIADEAIIQPFSIFCIFGHSVETGSITTTEHYFYSTAPRCKQTLSRVEYCTRSSCNYSTTLSQTIIGVACH